MADYLKISYYAEGHSNGRKVTLYDFCGHTYDEFTIELGRWQHCDTVRERQNLLLNIARRDYPEANWESAHVVEIHNA